MINKQQVKWFLINLIGFGKLYLVNPLFLLEIKTCKWKR